MKMGVRVQESEQHQAAPNNSAWHPRAKVQMFNMYFNFACFTIHTTYAVSPESDYNVNSFKSFELADLTHNRSLIHYSGQKGQFSKVYIHVSYAP
jgi:hypothetical protein